MRLFRPSLIPAGCSSPSVRLSAFFWGSAQQGAYFKAQNEQNRLIRAADHFARAG
jgi:hypothetical protein